MAQTPEGKVKKEIKEYLDSIGAYYFMPVQMGMGVRGTPDFLCCVRGRFVAIEAKAPGKEPNSFQKLTLARITETQGINFVCYGGKDCEEKLSYWYHLATGRLLSA